MKTAEQFLKENIDGQDYLTWKEAEILLIKFAKIHAEEALKQACKKVKATHGWGDLIDIDKSSIRKAYPIENIK